MFDRQNDPHACNLGPILAQSSKHESKGFQVLLVANMTSVQFPFCLATSVPSEAGIHAGVFVRSYISELEHGALAFQDACRDLSLGIQPGPN